MSGIIEAKNIDYSYKTSNEVIEVLNEVNYAFEEKKMYTIMGPSGSGKTTFLSLIGALDEVQKGEILFCGKNIKEIGYSKYRSNNVGMVFQSHNLLEYLSVIENVETVMEIAKYKKADKVERAGEFLEKVGIDSSMFRRNVKKLSGGEKQRVAIARAIAMNTRVILADEPTGSLDADTAKGIIEVLKKLAHEDGKCVIVVTHSEAVAKASDVVLKLSNKKLIEGNV